MQHSRSIVVLSLIALGIAIVYQSSFVSASKVQQSSTLESRVIELEQLVQELSDRVDMLEGSAERTSPPTTIPTRRATTIPAGPTAASNADLHTGPGTSFAVGGNATAGQSLSIIAITSSSDWYKLSNGLWIATFLVRGGPGGLPVDNGPVTPPTSEPVRIQEPDVEVCPCYYDLDCGDFSRERDAQACFNYCLDETGYDFHGFDADSDGLACESLP